MMPLMFYCGPTFRKLFYLLLLTIGLVSKDIHAAQSLSFSRFGTEKYAGNPGAELREIRYEDGMSIKVALYDGRDRSAVPMVILAGYAMDLSYLHPMATYLQNIGIPVALVQSPGQGHGLTYSGFKDGRDGYSNTVEGMATRYLDGVGKELSRYYGQKVALLGHSRAGYQTRIYLSGLRDTGQFREGRPILEMSKSSLREAKDYFETIVSLFSPLAPDARLVRSAANFPKLFEALSVLEEEMLRSHQANVALTRAMARGVSVFTNPLGFLFSAGGTARLAEVAVEVGAEHIKKNIDNNARARMVSLYLGQRDLDALDFAAFKIMAARTGLSVKDLIEGNEAVKWMLGRTDGISESTMQHLLTYPSKRGPTQAMVEEMARITGSGEQETKGISTWLTYGVSQDGRPFNVLKTLLRSRAQSDIPYHILHASGDGPFEPAEREAKLVRGQVSEIAGGHGGAVLSRDAIREIGRIVGRGARNK